MRKNFLKLAALLLVAPMLFSSCATIVSKSSYPVSIDTNPEGATVSITDKRGKEVYKGKSPATVSLKSGAGYFSRAEYQVRLTAPGYAEQVIPVNYKLNAWYFGNLVIGGVLGMLVIDPATGAMWKLETPPININLAKSTSSVTEPSLKIMNINDVPQEMKAKLVQVK
jgi:hypothetical protein